MMGISFQAIIMFVLGLTAIKLYEYQLFNKTALYDIRFWRNQLNAALLINVFGFFAIAMIFYIRYGYITDDLAYFRVLESYNRSFFSLRSGTEFMYWLTLQLKKYLWLDLPSLHILFGALGYIGSLNYLKVCTLRSDFRLQKFVSLHKIAVFVLLCFPNFMAWGRFFGKDSLTLFLTSWIVLSLSKLVINKKISLLEIIFFMGIPLYFLHLVRSHIALALGAGVGFGLVKFLLTLRVGGNIGALGLIRLVIPITAIILVGFLGVKEIKKLIGSNTKIDQESISNMFTQTTLIGAYGGSTTEIAEDIKTDSRAILKPMKVIANVGMLLFAPMPWKIRNVVDVIAILSNFLLLLLIIKYYKNIWSNDLLQVILLLLAVFLIILLSFMTANVGLILRQKTILLPFLFLILLFPGNKKIPNARS